MLATILPRKLYSSRYRWAWLAFLLLSPLFYAAGVRLQFKTDHNLQLKITIDRASAIQLAGDYAKSQQVDVTGWQSFCLVDQDNNLYYYQKSLPQAEFASIIQLAPPVAVKVQFLHPDKTENIEVFLNTNGQPLGFIRKFWQAIGTSALPEPAARELATKTMQARPEAGLIATPAAAKLEEENNDNELTRQYTWQWDKTNLPELQGVTTVAVRGDRIVQATSRARVTEQYAKQLSGWQPLKIGTSILYGLIYAVIAIFGIYRFVRRAREKEVSYQRTLIVAIGGSIVMSAVGLLSDVGIYDPVMQNPNIPIAIILVFSSITFMLMGAFCGLAYGSGEGDIREAYPGKLTSIDALLTGRIFSQNVARAVLWGFAWSALIMLADGLFNLFWVQRPNSGDEFLPLFMLFSWSPFLLNLVIWQYSAVNELALGLLLPLPFLRRLVKSEKLAVALLGFFTWVAFINPQQNFRPWIAVLLFAAVRATLTLFAFFKFDVLTAAVAIAIPSVSKFSWFLFAQPAASLHRDGWLLLGLFGGLLLVQCFFAWKGRHYRDEDVRPVYARNLAERLALTAEVSAARIAQERLLPQTLPISGHFTAAATCLPANEVGGDFYDFFALDNHRIGILCAEGGGRGLGSALTIAYAKGFLMSRLNQKNNANNDHSPTESLRALQTKLSQMLPPDEGIGIAYAELDTTDGEFRYARFGEFPRILLVPSAASDNSTSIPEQQIRFTPSAPEHEPYTLNEGRTTLADGAGIALYTGGLASACQQAGQSTEAWFAQIFKTAQAGTELQQTLNTQLNKSFKQLRKQKLSDDLTSVLIRFEAKLNSEL